MAKRPRDERRSTGRGLVTLSICLSLTLIGVQFYDNSVLGQWLDQQPEPWWSPFVGISFFLIFGLGMYGVVSVMDNILFPDRKSGNTAP